MITGSQIQKEIANDETKYKGAFWVTKVCLLRLKQPRSWKNCYLNIKSQTSTMAEEVDFATLLIFYRPTTKNK